MLVLCANQVVSRVVSIIEACMIDTNEQVEQNESNSFLLFKDTLSISYCQTRTHVKLECSNKMVDPKGALNKGWFLVKVY